MMTLFVFLAFGLRWEHHDILPLRLVCSTNSDTFAYKKYCSICLSYAGISRRSPNFRRYWNRSIPSTLFWILWRRSTVDV